MERNTTILKIDSNINITIKTNQSTKKYLKWNHVSN